ncbi:MAG: hypothetical protein HRU30_04535 [Rhodobacteraceae bacterium]|nr:hypothetical protein [Paracoccaceae bacterium]
MAASEAITGGVRPRLLNEFGNPVQTQIYEDAERLVVSRTQDTQFILDDNNRLSSELQHHRGDLRLAGRVPFVVAEQWARECGARIGSKEFGLYCKQKMMDGEFAKLRVRGF